MAVPVSAAAAEARTMEPLGPSSQSMELSAPLTSDEWLQPFSLLTLTLVTLRPKAERFSIFVASGLGPVRVPSLAATNGMTVGTLNLRLASLATTVTSVVFSPTRSPSSASAAAGAATRPSASDSPASSAPARPTQRRAVAWAILSENWDLVVLSIGFSLLWARPVASRAVA